MKPIPFFLIAILLAPHAELSAADLPKPGRPNIIIIFADDLGWGDLGCYGHPSIRTPHLDRMAAEGIRFTDFCSAAEVCTPKEKSAIAAHLGEVGLFGEEAVSWMYGVGVRNLGSRQNAAAMWLPPERDQLHMAYQTVVDGYFTNVEVAEFIGCAVRVLPGPVIAIWDGGSMHKGGPISTLVEESHGRLDIEPLPPYASELMPVEYLWRWLKHGRLCNFCPRDAHELNKAITRELDPIRDNQALLSSFFHQSRLPLPRALLT